MVTVTQSDERLALKTKPHHELRWTFNTFLELILPSTDENPSLLAEDRHLLSRKMIQENTTKEAVFRLIEGIRTMPIAHQASLVQLAKADLHRDQIALFIQASTDQERQDLYQAWMGPAPRNEVAHQALERSSNVGAVLFLGGLNSLLIILHAGYALGDPNWTETSKVMAQAMTQPFPEAGQLFSHLADGSAMQAGVLAASVFSAGKAILEAMTRENPDVLTQNATNMLADRIDATHGRDDRFGVDDIERAKEKAHHELGKIPAPYRTLITHFKARELVVFLLADDELREEMLRINPPAFKQRIDAACALNPGIMAGVSARIRLGSTTWNGDGIFKASPGQVSLSNTMSALINARREARESTQIEPNAQPSFGPSP